MSAADKAKEIVQDLTGMWWPDADEGGLRDAAMAKALDQYADAVHKAVKHLEHELESVGATISPAPPSRSSRSASRRAPRQPPPPRSWGCPPRSA
ncbi:hypothetical protein [Streptomyces sp. NPDC004065]|uniref:hypothetical protein n=1 Tax=Streptomyces sp. NPDC004065 TaxID=3364689 RepID=UPI00384B1F71